MKVRPMLQLSASSSLYPFRIRATSKRWDWAVGESTLGTGGDLPRMLSETPASGLYQVEEG
ncbi:MAG: hypothetical protein E2O74_01935 [Chloroflexi bacterium]|nr:MAG: hypothetical protein E2O74_01935 [Chloroflexota bacterium]